MSQQIWLNSGIQLGDHGQRLLRAMVLCHNYHNDGNYVESGPDLPGYMGKDMAIKFCAAAETSLTSEHLEALIEFFLELPTMTPDQNLIDGLDDKLAQFYVEEQAASGRDNRYLDNELSGCLFAKLGIILHCATKILELGETDPVKPFFREVDSPSIKALFSKGFSERLNVGTDALRRAGHTRKPGDPETACPQRVWTREAQKLHHAIFQDILNALHTPLFVVGGKCPLQHYWAYVRENSNDRVKFEVQLPGGQTLVFVIALRLGRVIRVAVKMHHPSAAYNNPKGDWPDMSRQQDAACNLMFWLIAQSHKPSEFSRTNRYDETSSRPQPSRFQKGEQREKTQWDLVPDYCRRERATYRYTGCLLQIDDYSPEFIDWIEDYLGESAGAILESGRPLAECAKRLSVFNRGTTGSNRKPPVPKPQNLKVRAEESTGNGPKFKWTSEAEAWIRDLRENQKVDWYSIADRFSKKYCHKLSHKTLENRLTLIRQRGDDVATPGQQRKDDIVPPRNLLWTPDTYRQLIELREGSQLDWPEIAEEISKIIGKPLKWETVKGQFSVALKKEDLWKTAFGNVAFPALEKATRGPRPEPVVSCELQVTGRRESDPEKPPPNRTKKNRHHWPDAHNKILLELRENPKLKWSSLTILFNLRTGLTLKECQLKSHFRELQQKAPVADSK